MWGIVSTAFLALYGLMGFYLGRRGWSTLGKPLQGIYRKVYWMFFGVLILSFPLAEVGQQYLPEGTGQWLTVWGWYAMLAVVYLFLILLIVDSVRVLDKWVHFLPNKIRGNTKMPKTIATFLLILVTLTLIFGTWNARNPVVTKYELTLDKDTPLKELRVAMVSDLHFGEVIDENRLFRMVELMDQLQPDLILIAGDLTDGSLSKEAGANLLSTLKQMNAKYGIYAVPGNHDRWVNRDVELVRSFEERGIQFLMDEQVKVENAFYVIGRNDPGHNRAQGRKALEDVLQGVDTSLPLLLLDHQPIDLQIAEKNAIDVQFSGHTHRGQIFPSSLITGYLYDLDWGLLTRGSYNLIVSLGYGTWGPPLRIGTQPEVVYLTLKFR
jgi:uncharacterized protein